MLVPAGGAWLPVTTVTCHHHGPCGMGRDSRILSGPELAGWPALSSVGQPYLKPSLPGPPDMQA